MQSEAKEEEGRDFGNDKANNNSLLLTTVSNRRRSITFY